MYYSVCQCLGMILLLMVVHVLYGTFSSVIGLSYVFLTNN